MQWQTGLRAGAYLTGLLASFGLGYLTATGGSEAPVALPASHTTVIPMSQVDCPLPTVAAPATLEPIMAIAEPDTITPAVLMVPASCPECVCPVAEIPKSPEWSQVDTKVQDMFAYLKNRELSPQVRAAAVQFMALLDTPSAKTELLRVLNDESEDMSVRAEVMRYGDWSQYPDALLEFFQQSPQEELRKMAIYTAQTAQFDESERMNFDQQLFSQFTVQPPAVQKTLLEYFAGNPQYFPVLLEITRYASEEVAEYAEKMVKRQE